MPWSYDGRDIGIRLYDACMHAGAPMDLPDGAKVLEIGCCEADWLHIAAACWPTVLLTGVDCRTHTVTDTDGRVQRIAADAMRTDLFEPESFDAIVSLSAIEHFGLGHYGDPKDPDGDLRIMTNAFTWLKPGGSLYFDVPYDPAGYRLLNTTECRVYDEAERWRRLWQDPLARAKARARWAWEGYSTALHPGTLIPKPTESCPRSEGRFYYAAMVWTKC